MRLLVLDGFEVACAQTGGDGLARATEGAWQVIVLDLHLPDLLGMTVLSELRRHAITTPVIVVTGWYLDDAGHERAAAALGATFLRKPLDSDQLASALRAAAAGGAPPPRVFSRDTAGRFFYRSPGIPVPAGRRHRCRAARSGDCGRRDGARVTD